MSWLHSWSKRKKITLTGGSSGSQTDYQIKLDIIYNNSMQVDFDDLRFTQLDGKTLLNTWLESKIDGESCIVWIKTDTPANSVDADIYMYYGNSGVSDNWDIGNTFLFGDDFTGLLTDNWTMTGTSFDINNDNLRSLDAVGTLITSNQAYLSSTSDEVMEAKLQVATGHTNTDEMVFGIGEDAGRPDDPNHFGLRTQYSTVNKFLFDYNGTWEIGGSYNPASNVWFTAKLTKTTSTLYLDIYDADGTNVKSESISNAFTNNNLLLYCNHRSGYPYDDQRWDWIFTRKYVANPATYEIKAEEPERSFIFPTQSQNLKIQPKWKSSVGIVESTVSHNCRTNGIPRPVLAMPMWEGAGNRTIDLSGYGNHGDLSGQPKWVGGSDGIVLDFDGTNDYVDCGSKSVLDINNNFTIEAWIKIPTYVSPGSMIMWGEVSTGKRRSMFFWNGGAGNGRLYFSGFGGANNIDSGIQIDDNIWHHCVTTFDSSNYARTYVDGVAGGHGSTTVVAYSYTGSHIGQNIDNTERVDGKIAGVRIYDSVLDDRQIKFLYDDPHFMYRNPQELYGYVLSNPMWYYNLLKRRE